MTYFLQQSGTRQSIIDFMYEYLTERCSEEKERLETGYSLLSACEKYSRDDEIHLFYR